MKIQSEGGKLLCLFLLTLATTVTSQDINNTCPFTHLFHFGDGFTDIGNSIHVSPKDHNPARLPPYGITFPGWPTGRWTDGFVDMDYAAMDFGLPNVVPYLTLPAALSNDGVIFSAARSPVLSRSFYESQGITIPSYAVPLDEQIHWFKEYLKSVCSTTEECADFLAKSLIVMGDMEGNDAGYALTQGKSIEEAETYMLDTVDVMINTSRELLKLGGPGSRVIIPGTGPLGCTPDILTALWSVDPTEFDEIGCLKKVNKLMLDKNALLRRETENLQKEFPNSFVYFSAVYSPVYAVIKNASVIGKSFFFKYYLFSKKKEELTICVILFMFGTGQDGINKALKCCCGIGGRYNYDSNRFCGSPGVPVCSNPKEYIFWDGFHFTQETYYKMEHLLVQNPYENLNCSSPSSNAVRTSSSVSGKILAYPVEYDSTETIHYEL